MPLFDGAIQVGASASVEAPRDLTPAELAARQAHDARRGLPPRLTDRQAAALEFLVWAHDFQATLPAGFSHRVDRAPVSPIAADEWEGRAAQLERLGALLGITP